MPQNKNVRIGSWITLNHMAIADIMATAGFEWLCIDIEHSVIDFYAMQVMIATIQARGIKAFVRVGGNDSILLKRVCDAGVDGIICPMINTKEEALQLVSNIKYSPKGNRGVGLARAQHYGLDEGFEKYKTKKIEIIAQIEHYKAIENLEEILQVDGIDGTFIGPYDLSGSMGKPGMFDDDDVKQQIVLYEQKAKNFNKLVGFHVIQPNANFLNEKVKAGYNFISFSIDTLFLGLSCRNELEKFKILSNQ